MPRAMQVTEESLDHIVIYGKAMGLRLDDVKDDLEEARFYGWNLYAIVDGTVAFNNAVFSTMSEPSFRQTWKFKTAETPNRYMEIERV